MSSMLINHKKKVLSIISFTKINNKKKIGFFSDSDPHQNEVDPQH